MKHRINILIYLVGILIGVLITSKYYLNNPVSSSDTDFLNSSKDLAIMVFDENTNDYARQDWKRWYF